MYMQEERLLVLKMLQDGKINVDQAEKLLNALSYNNFDYDNYFCECKQSELECKIKKISRSIDGLVKDLGDGAKNIYKNMEPKLIKAAQCFTKKAAAITQELSEKLSQASDKLNNKSNNKPNNKIYEVDDDAEEE